MSTPPLGMITVPHWEWWLHHHPFRRYCEGGRTCPICESDTGCCRDCPQQAIEQKFEEVVALMREWNGRHDVPDQSKPLSPKAGDIVRVHYENGNMAAMVKAQEIAKHLKEARPDVNFVLVPDSMKVA